MPECPACNEVFRSLGGFDMHKVGKMDDRRCLSVQEMQAKGMKKNQYGWGMPLKDKDFFKKRRGSLRG